MTKLPDKSILSADEARCYERLYQCFVRSVEAEKSSFAVIVIDSEGFSKD